MIDLISLYSQAVSGSKEVDKRNKVLWVWFETGDVNDLTLPHLLSESQGGGEGEGNGAYPLILTLGFSNGYSMWLIPVRREGGGGCRYVKESEYPKMGRGVCVWA